MLLHIVVLIRLSVRHNQVPDLDSSRYVRGTSMPPNAYFSDSHSPYVARWERWMRRIIMDDESSLRIESNPHRNPQSNPQRNPHWGSRARIMKSPPAASTALDATWLRLLQTALSLSHPQPIHQVLYFMFYILYFIWLSLSHPQPIHQVYILFPIFYVILYILLGSLCPTFNLYIRFSLSFVCH